MPFEKFDLENLDKERRKAIANSIRTISVEELKKLGEEIFHYADDPWRETFFRFIAENAGATFHHAVTSDGVNIVYCRDKDKGMWFLPGSGMGPLQATVQQFHVAQQLRLVDWQHFFYGLGFHQHAALHQQIEPQSLFPREAFVFDRHKFLADTL